MTARARRRIVGLAILAVVSAAFLVTIDSLEVGLRDAAHFSGWTLLAVMLFLALYNVRKKFPVPSFVSARVWLQAHIYAGLFTFVAYYAHAGGFGPPTGMLEGALWLLYMGVALSGIAGLFITRTFPQRLTSRGEEVVFERIPQVLRDLRIKVESLAEESIEKTGAPTIAEFYTKRLRSFFERPRHALVHIAGYHSILTWRMSEIDDQMRYLNDNEKKTLGEIARCVRAKDAVDHQYALQLALKLWLFVHIPLTYAALLFAFVHVLLVYAFSGSS